MRVAALNQLENLLETAVTSNDLNLGTVFVSIMRGLTSGWAKGESTFVQQLSVMRRVAANHGVKFLGPALKSWVDEMVCHFTLP